MVLLLSTTPVEPSTRPPATDLQHLANRSIKEFEDYQRLTSQGKLRETGQKFEQHKRTLEEIRQKTRPWRPITSKLSFGHSDFASKVFSHSPQALAWGWTVVVNTKTVSTVFWGFSRETVKTVPYFQLNISQAEAWEE